MRSATLAYKGVRCSSISAVPPARDSPDYSTDLAELAKDIIYRSPIPHGGTPLYIATAAAIPDAKEVDFDSLLPYVLARLPSENELIEGRSYEIIFFTGDETDGPTKAKKSQPSLAWFLKAYKVLPRVLRKRLQKLYIVHEKPWVRFLLEAFSTVVTPKSRKKLYHGKIFALAYFFLAFVPVYHIVDLCCYVSLLIDRIELRLTTAMATIANTSLALSVLYFLYCYVEATVKLMGRCPCSAVSVCAFDLYSN